jgi:tRNA pseudouridine38-40 synthase
MRHAFLVAYDGTRYFGFVRQPRAPTVEGELLRAFRKFGLFKDLKRCRYGVAARTDRNVGALSQVVALDVEREPELSELNSELPEDIAILACRPVQMTFDPRREVLAKHYRYVCMPPKGFDLERVKRAARLLEGMHNFKCFCKPEGNTWNSLMFARVKVNEFLTFDFIAKFFLRQQVRRMVEGLLELGKREIGEEWFAQAVRGNAPRSFKPAPPEGLFLARTKYRRLVFKMSRAHVLKLASYLEDKGDPRSCEMLRFLSSEL